jgi:hypothetical protein
MKSITGRIGNCIDGKYSTIRILSVSDGGMLILLIVLCELALPTISIQTANVYARTACFRKCNN